MRILLAYDSLSGNTREASRLVRDSLVSLGHDTTEICVSLRGSHENVLTRPYDLHVLGTWTGGLGRTPEGMKRFIATLAQLPAPLRPADVALFGTGETQWGMSYFCGALDRIASYFKTDYPMLKLEQMPANVRDRQAIADWVNKVIEHHSQKRKS